MNINTDKTVIYNAYLKRGRKITELNYNKKIDAAIIATLRKQIAELNEENELLRNAINNGTNVKVVETVEPVYHCDGRGGEVTYRKTVKYVEGGQA